MEIRRVLKLNQMRGAHVRRSTKHVTVVRLAADAIRRRHSLKTKATSFTFRLQTRRLLVLTLPPSHNSARFRAALLHGMHVCTYITSIIQHNPCTGIFICGKYFFFPNINKLLRLIVFTAFYSLLELWNQLTNAPTCLSNCSSTRSPYECNSINLD